MENLDLIVLTILVVIVFAIFSVTLLRSFGSEDGIKPGKIKTTRPVIKD